MTFARTSHRWLAVATGLVLGAAAGCTQEPVDDPLPMPPPVDGWRLTFEDNFDGEAGAAIDTTKWSHDVGGHGWGNQQLEFNTDRTANAQHDGDGKLVIAALKQQLGANEYTSARLRTQGKFDQAYGRFEARVKLPEGQGLWPAFWMLSTKYNTVGWPECGELDIMEVRGSEPGVVHGSAHGPGYSGGNPKSDSYTLPGGKSFSDDFHVFSLEWSPGEVHWFVDGNHYHAIEKSELGPGQRWVYDDNSMFVILNVAVGGWFGGDVDPSVFPQTMEVDYVRVYEAAAP
jgi:beta-glucanase (GH16 family)